MRDTVTSDASMLSGMKTIQKNLDLEELVMPGCEEEEKVANLPEPEDDQFRNTGMSFMSVNNAPEPNQVAHMAEVAQMNMSMQSAGSNFSMLSVVKN
jgi:hypothetical protein